jgi:hypothetical protein
MALPKIQHPTYEVTIPSTGQKVNMRPFTVREEKLLLMAKSSEKSEDIIKTIRQIIENCIEEKIEVYKLATFDIEYLFIKLRAKSIGEVVDLEYTDPDSGEVIKFKVNLDEIEVKKNPNHKNTFTVFGDVGVKMRYPTMEELTILDANNEDKAISEILYKCIVSIFDEKEVYTEFTEEELNNFINSFPLDAIAKIKEFFDTMPTLEKVVTLKNKEGDKKEIVLRGINSFFMY